MGLPALLALALLAGATARPALGAEQLVLPPQLECGRYRLKGMVTGRRGIDVLKIYPLTTAEWELPVLGMPTEQALALDGIYITLEVDVFRLQKSDPPRSKYLKTAARSNRHDVLVSAVQKLQTRPCGPTPPPGASAPSPAAGPTSK